MAIEQELTHIASQRVFPLSMDDPRLSELSDFQKTVAVLHNNGYTKVEIAMILGEAGIQTVTGKDQTQETVRRNLLDINRKHPGTIDRSPQQQNAVDDTSEDNSDTLVDLQELPEDVSSFLAKQIANQRRSKPIERQVVGPFVKIETFEDIFGKFQTPLLHFILRIIGNSEVASDLTQDVFVKAYKALQKGTQIPEGALSSWLYRIAFNTARDWLRRKRLIAWLPLSLFSEDRGVGAGLPEEQKTEDGEARIAAASLPVIDGYDGGRFDQHIGDREVVQTVLDLMPAKYRACLILFEYEGFSCTEIGEFLGLSPSAVKMRLMRAREAFREIYKKVNKE